jgi:Na+-driven multidrug efflux pump
MPRLLLLNNTILMLCTSIYLGTGVTLVFFQLPLEPLLTPDSYYMVFVKPVQLATQFFTWMTIVMLVTGLIMLVSEWFSGIRWVPVVVLGGVIASTTLTIGWIFDLNARLAEGVTDPGELKTLLHTWSGYNRIRASLWAVQWLAMMCWFYRLAQQARADR